MADLGAIGRPHEMSFVVREADTRWDALTSLGPSANPQAPKDYGSFSGTVKILGVNEAHARVYLINKATERVEFFTRSNADGSFKFALVPHGTTYTCVAYANSGTHNAAVLDKIVVV